MSVLQDIEIQESKNPLVNREYYLTVNLLHFVGFRAIEISEEMKMLIVQQNIPYQKHSLRILNFHVQTFLWKSSLLSHLCGSNGGMKWWITNCTPSCPKLMRTITQDAQIKKYEVIINRLRIGHTRLTQSFRMENRPHPPLCDECEGNHELTVKHILIECSFLEIIRRRHYDVTDLNQLFKTVSSKRILDFARK